MTTNKKSKSSPSNNKHDNKLEETCEWHIDSKKHFNCFWIYVIDKSMPDGSMPELTQAEIAHLLGWSNTKTHFMLKQAMEELVQALTTHKANQLISKDPDQNIDINSFGLDLVTNYTSEDVED